METATFQLIATPDDELIQRMSESYGAQPLLIAAESCVLSLDRAVATVYAIRSGELRVRDAHGIELYRLHRGDVAGALSLWTELGAPVQIETVTDAELVSLSAETFRNLLKIDRKLQQRLAPVMQARMRRLQLAQVLHKLFADDNPMYVRRSQLDNGLYNEIATRAEWRHLQHGETLFRAGEMTQCLSIVVNGRLELRVNERAIGTVKSAEAIGATPIITQTPLRMSAIAVRETTLLNLPAPLCVDLWRDYTNTTLPFLRQALTRQQHMVDALNAKPTPPTTIALVPTTARVPIERLAYELEEAIRPMASVRRLTRDAVNAQFDQDNIVDTVPDDPAHPLLVEWLNALELSHTHLVYVADPTWSEWTRRCLQQADRVLLVADAAVDPNPTVVERGVFASGLTSRVDLVLLHAADVTQPRGTAAWLDVRDVTTHYHVRQQTPAHMARLARRLTGHATGLVLAGGGAKGYAHLGVMQRLEELDVAIDLIGGTSMGGLLGAAFAMDWDSNYVVERSADLADPKKLFDYTLPFVALFRSGKVTRMLQSLFGDQQIEDLWRPFFAIAANLSTNDIRIFSRGDLWRAVRATLAIPGVFVPMADLNGDVLVDGGIVNNFPVDIMRERVDGGRIIGVKVDETRRGRPYEHRPMQSGWALLWARLNPFAKSPRVPTIGGTLARVAMMNNNKLMAEMVEQCDVLVQPSTRHIQLMAFEQYLQAAAAGYEAAQKIPDVEFVG